MSNDLEVRLQQIITKWTSHMKWRSDYDKWVNGRIWQENYQQEGIKELQDTIGDLEGKMVLDLGCGMGGFSVALLQKGINVVPLDFNWDYCQITKLRGKRYNLDPSPVNDLGECLPFRERSFDIISCFDVLEHVRDPTQVLNEAHRVLKPTGKMCLSVINKYAWRDPHYHLRFINWMPRRIAEWHIMKRGHTKSDAPCQDKQKLTEMHYFTFRQFKKIASSLGFTVTDRVEIKICDGAIDKLRMRRIIEILVKLKMARMFYRVARYFLMNSFAIVLTKAEESAEKSEDSN